jgi:hypothetical protein
MKSSATVPRREKYIKRLPAVGLREKKVNTPITSSRLEDWKSNSVISKGNGFHHPSHHKMPPRIAIIYVSIIRYAGP